MGIVFIGIFMLAALVLLVRGLRLHNGRAVSVVLCLALLAIQATQLAATIGEGSFRFSMTEYLVLSGLFASVTFIDFSRRRKFNHMFHH